MNDRKTVRLKPHTYEPSKAEIQVLNPRYAGATPGDGGPRRAETQTEG